jgi:ribokinase
VAHPTLVAVGDLLVDVVVRGGPGHAARVSLRPGGSAANVAVWAASLGARASVIGRVGDDVGGTALRAALGERGVEVLLTTAADEPTGTFVLLGNERFVDRGANATLRPEHLPERIEADVVAISPYIAPATAAAAVERARAGWVVALGKPLRGANGVVVSELEGAEGVHVLAERFRLACVTFGALGAIAVLDGQETSVSAPAVEPKHDLGAGDAFAAALLVALARGESLPAALAEACRRGAEAVASSTGWPVVK